ncbi:hypothetical protein C7S14_7292 [Burkholderia cepacia]|nr:hypothetical protein C7S14_7292 [Burkholderia cepacia]
MGRFKEGTRRAPHDRHARHWVRRRGTTGRRPSGRDAAQLRPHLTLPARP